MRILVYGLNFTPEPTGIGKYTGEMAEWMQQQAELRVVTAPPYYPAWRISAGYSAFSYVQEHVQNMQILRCPLWVPYRVSGLKRLIHLLSFAVSSLPIVLWQGLTWRPDVVVVIAPAFFCTLGGWLTAKLARGQAWLHIQDLEVDAAFDMGFLPKGLQPLAMGIEGWLLRRFARVSTIANQMVDRLVDKGVESKRVWLFPNWVDTHEIYPLNSSSMRRELGIPPDQVVVLYSGNMNQKQGLDVILAAAQRLAIVHPHVLFLLCGDGPSRVCLEKTAQGLKTVRFLPLQSKEKLNQLLNLADIHLLPQRREIAAAVMPSKLTGILACGGALIATTSEGTELAQVVLEGGGLICPPGDDVALVAKLILLIENPQLRQQMGQKARAYALAHLSKESILAQFHQQLSLLTRPQESIVPVQVRF